MEMPISQFLVSTHCRSPMSCKQNIVWGHANSFYSFSFTWPNCTHFLGGCLQVYNLLIGLHLNVLKRLAKQQFPLFQNPSEWIPRVASWLFLGQQRICQSSSSSQMLIVAARYIPGMYSEDRLNSTFHYTSDFWMNSEFYSYLLTPPQATKEIPVSQVPSAVD